MKYNKDSDQWIGTPVEHLKKLPKTHDCFCNQARQLIQLIIDSEVQSKSKRIKR